MRSTGRRITRAAAARGLLLLALLLLPAAAQAHTEREKRVSLELEAVSLPEAMSLLANRAGVEIRIEESLKKTISSVYTNETIENIVHSMLKDLNHVSIWDYRRDELDSISIWVYEAAASPPRIQHERISKLVQPAASPKAPAQPRVRTAAAAGSRIPHIPDSAKNAPLSVPSSTKGGGTGLAGNAGNAGDRDDEGADAPSSGLSGAAEDVSAAAPSSAGTTASAGEGTSTASAGTASGGGAGGLPPAEPENEEVTVPEEAEESFRMPILQSFSTGDREVLASGEVEAGVVRTGDRVKIIGVAQSPIEATVLQIEISGDPVDQAASGDLASLLLSGVGGVPIQGGTVVSASAEADADPPPAYERFEAVVFVVKKDVPLFNEVFSRGGALEFAFEGATVTGNGAFTGETSEVEITGETGGYALISATLSSPVVMEPGVWFDIAMDGDATASGRVVLVVE